MIHANDRVYTLLENTKYKVQVKLEKDSLMYMVFKFSHYSTNALLVFVNWFFKETFPNRAKIATSRVATNIWHILWHVYRFDTQHANSNFMNALFIFVKWFSKKTFSDRVKIATSLEAMNICHILWHVYRFYSLSNWSGILIFGLLLFHVFIVCIKVFKYRSTVIFRMNSDQICFNKSN